jgi:hypothetical protein
MIARPPAHVQQPEMDSKQLKKWDEQFQEQRWQKE